MATVTGTKRHLAITSTTYDSSGDVVVGGNLTVEGTTTTLDTANLLVEDKNIIIGNVSTPSDTTADGGGITLKGASDYTINWINANNRWEFNQGIHSTGNITGANLSGTNTGDQTLTGLDYAATSHNHDGRYLRTHSRYSDDLDTITTSGVYIWDVSEADDEPTGASDGLLTIKYWDSTSWATANFQDFHANKLYIKSKQSNTWQADWARVWTTDQLTDAVKGQYDTAFGWGDHALAGYLDTAYTAGNGLSLSGTEFRMAGGSIGGSVDLDTYTSSGYYVQGSNSQAGTGTNWPAAYAGILTVVRAEGNTTHITQTYDQYNSNAFYNRSYYDGTWSSWRNLAQDTNTQRAVHDTPVDAATTTSISSNWAFDNVKTAVPANALFTDTTYNLSGYLLNTTDTLTGNLTIDTGGLIIEGSVDSGATNMGYYESAGTNIILKGDSVGRSGIFFESEKDGTNINDPSDYGFIQFHSYGYGNTTGEANNLVIGVSNDSTDKVILQAPYNGGVMIGYKDATSGTDLTLSEVIHSNASSYNNGNWDTAYTHAGSTHAPTNAEQNVQSDWNATAGDALILNKPSIPAASGKGQNIDYIASNLPSSDSTYRNNFGSGVWAYSGYSTGTDRPFTYDATLQVMPTAAFGFELSTSWHSTGEGSLKIRALRDCCEGWGDYHDVWTSDNFANNSANWNSAYGWGDHASAGYLETDSNLLKSNADDTFTGRLSVGSTNSRRAGIYGIYDSYKTGHIWSMGTGYMIPSNGSDFGNLYGFAYKHTNNTTGGTMGGGHQAVWCTGGTPRASIGESGIWTSGNVTHTGLTMTDGTDIDQIKSYTKSLALTSSWQDTGVNGAELATGTYTIQVTVDNNGANGYQYDEMYSGTMTWYGSNTNSTDHDEIVLHAAGHARNGKSIFLRTLRTTSSDANDLKLQIRDNRNATQTASNYIFKFRRLI